jgi:hypothetical protein
LLARNAEGVALVSGGAWSQAVGFVLLRLAGGQASVALKTFSLLILRYEDILQMLYLK